MIDLACFDLFWEVVEHNQWVHGGHCDIMWHHLPERSDVFCIA